MKLLKIRSRLTH